MKQVALGSILGSLGMGLLMASGCGGSAFSASEGASGAANGAASGMIDAAGTTDPGGSTSSGGETSSTGGQFGTAGMADGGGGSSTGGASSSAGSTSTAGGGSCVTGTVTFKMLPGKGNGTAAFCSGCFANWLTITSSNGQAVVLDRSCSTADCSTCTPTACPPVACLNQTIPAEGLTRDWDETQWVDSNCGAGAVACAASHCVAPGKYKAKMCALKNTTPNDTFCTPGDSPVCTEVDFVLPGAKTVQGVIGG